jgi:hypothetical protein
MGTKINLKPLIILLMSTSALAQTPVLNVSWSPVTTQEDGTVIDSSDVTYTVYNSINFNTLCQTSNLKCTIDINYSECLTMYATASQVSTALESAPSNAVTACAEPKPNYPLSAPVISVTITSG